MRSVCTVIILLLILHTLLLAWGALRHAPGWDEPGHLAAGISHWGFGRFELYRVNPPLVRMVAAVPVMLATPKLDWNSFYYYPKGRSEFLLGANFVRANGARSIWLFTLSRWACIPFSLLGAYICFRWARELYGDSAGMLALTLWCFSPNVIAHAQMITPDAGATGRILILRRRMLPAV